MTSTAVVTGPSATRGPSRLRGNFLKIAAELVCALLRFISNDDAARVALLASELQQQLPYRKFFDSAVDPVDKDRQRIALHNACVTSRVVFAYQVNKSLGCYQVAKQMLSLLVSPGRNNGLTRREIATLCTRRRELSVADPVLVLTRVGNHWDSGVVTRVGAGSIDAEPMIGPARKRTRQPLQLQLTNVPSAKVRHSEDPYCTLHAVRVAIRHCMRSYPGAPAPSIVNNLPRTVGKKAEVLANFLRCAANVALADGGSNTAKRGIKFYLKDNPAALYRNLCKELAAVGEGNSSKEQFYAIVGHNNYAKLEANVCCCALCRDLGFYAFALLRDICNLVFPMLEQRSACSWMDLKTILRRVDEQERFMSGQFTSHLSEASSTASHCRKHQLSTRSDGRFKCPCVHSRGDGRVAGPLETREAFIERTQRRKANAAKDWEPCCSVCADSESQRKGRLQCCMYCPTAVHAACAMALHADDFPRDDDPEEVCWVCPQCAEVLASEKHDTRCNECDELWFMIRDLKHTIQKGQSQAGSDRARDLLSWAKAALAKCTELLRLYRAHKVRESNQSQYQRWQLKCLKLHQAIKQSDWWGKIPHRRHMTACCEFSQGGIGMMSSYYVFLNPTQATRDRYRRSHNIDFDAYPSPPPSDETGDGGPVFLCEFHRTCCNDATQGSFETAAVRLATDEAFMAEHPWVTEISGEDSDGATKQFQCTLAAM